MFRSVLVARPAALANQQMIVRSISTSSTSLAKKKSKTRNKVPSSTSSDGGSALLGVQWMKGKDSSLQERTESRDELLEAEPEVQQFKVHKSVPEAETIVSRYQHTLGQKLKVQSAAIDVRPGPAIPPLSEAVPDWGKHYERDYKDEVMKSPIPKQTKWMNRRVTQISDHEFENDDAFAGQGVPKALSLNSVLDIALEDVPKGNERWAEDMGFREALGHSALAQAHDISNMSVWAKITGIEGTQVRLGLGGKFTGYVQCPGLLPKGWRVGEVVAVRVEDLELTAGITGRAYKDSALEPQIMRTKKTMAERQAEQIPTEEERTSEAFLRAITKRQEDRERMVKQRQEERKRQRMEQRKVAAEANAVISQGRGGSDDYIDPNRARMLQNYFNLRRDAERMKKDRLAKSAPTKKTTSPLETV
eukprot:Clim_evm19s99 gene=Clim_evmTU19s99